MASVATHPINDFRPAKNPEILQLYSFPTPNGIKVSALLEELGVDYEAHTISIMRDDQFNPGFLAINPNNKIPALIDPTGDSSVELFESASILIYLAEKYGKFLPASGTARAETLNWLMWQMGGLGPMLGQFGHFYKFAADKVKDPYAVNRYTDEAKRFLGVLDKHLEGKDFVAAGEYTIADMAIWPWLKVVDFYGGEEVLGMADYKNVTRYLETHLARPASQAALNIPDRNG
ncbi:GST-like protein [Rubricella aquisinus]|uniref:GST-like protein n=1 Tax=Rubricella aquisinus TaxID=2028108 RepID=A0A840WKG4_9RHOB|nr:glutathione S-transferase N-terminal domain-containing protein [Rubricella aquisinus]MBB5515011.1 GST-like protein [Rubricella aquisinus]